MKNKAMTVGELIQKLQSIDDIDLEVIFYTHFLANTIESIQKIPDGCRKKHVRIKLRGINSD